MVERHQTLGLYIQGIEGQCGPVELAYLVILAGIGLDDADCGHVLLHDRIQSVVLLENFPEKPGGTADEYSKEHAQHYHRNQEDDAQAGVDEEAHHQRGNHIQRGPERGAQQHLESILNARHVGGHASHQAGGAELVDVRKGETADVGVHRGTQIRGKPAAGIRCEATCQYAEGHAEAGKHYQLTAIMPD